VEPNRHHQNLKVLKSVAHAQKKSGSVTMWNNPPKVWTTHFKINAQQYKAIPKIGYYIYA
jgi:hypothetical protein